MVDKIVNPWQPQPEQSLGWLSGVGTGSTVGGQNVWNPLEGRWQQIAPQSAWGSIPNQGMIVGNASSITPERVAQMGLTWDAYRQGWNWNPSAAERTQMADYWASPEGKAMLGKYAQPSGGGAPLAGYGLYNPNTRVSSPYTGGYGGNNWGQPAGTTPPGTTPPVTDPAAAAAGIPGTGTGGQFNYPMNPLGDAASQPNIVAQNKLLEMMQTDPYLSGLLQPYLNEAYSAIGKSGMPTSSYTDQMLAQTIAPLYLANQNNVLGGYGALSPQLMGLSQEYRQPFESAMNMLYQFYA